MRLLACHVERWHQLLVKLNLLLNPDVAEALLCDMIPTLKLRILQAQPNDDKYMLQCTVCIINVSQEKD
jgi:hypothetical protein